MTLSREKSSGVRSYHEIAGERPAPVIDQAVSLQARFSNYLAFGLSAIVGIGLLIWYYTHAWTSLKDHARALQHAPTKVAPDDVPPPSLGLVRVPIAATRDNASEARGEGEANADSIALAASLPTAMPMALAASPIKLNPATGTSRTGRTTAGQSALGRRMSGDAFVAVSPSIPTTLMDASVVARGETNKPVAPREDLDALDTLLSKVSAPMELATTLPTSSLILSKGTFIDCTLETAIESTLPGMTTCVTATDTFGADGQVVLLERGTRIIGETRGQVQQGSARVFVLWTEARTPAGVDVPLDAPGTDELGRSGLAGQVDHHFWQRFGAAVLLTVIDGAVQAGVQASAADRGGTVIYNPGASQDVMSEVLKGTVAIPPTLMKRNGDRIQVFVARDVDFRGVYELVPTRGAH
jgi:type IV secretion system protein VirB10